MLRNKKNDDDFSMDDDGYGFQMQSDSQRQHRIRKEQTLEAEILENDTLISISLRFNCTVADIKRLNKIHNDNEIYAFKVLKVPLTAHNILLDTLPKVHKSGSNSPRNTVKSIATNTELPNKEKLEEKLLIASVTNATIKSDNVGDIVNEENLNDEVNEPLLRSNTHFRGYPRTLGPPKNDFLSFSGSDCELNWIILLIGILFLAFIVPLIYVYFVYEHPEKFNHTHSRYDDQDLHFRAHFNDDKNLTTKIPK